MARPGIIRPSAPDSTCLVSCREPSSLYPSPLRKLIPTLTSGSRQLTVPSSVLFLVSAFLQVALSRAQKKEKRYGPGPSNNYTSGSGKKKFWQRKNRQNKTHRDAEAGILGAGALTDEKHHHHNNNNNNTRPSNDTAMTGTTAPVVADGYGGPNTKYGNEPTIPAQSAGFTPQRNEYPPRNDYAPQTTGVTGGRGGVPEMAGAQVGSHNQPYTQHANEPYVEVHHGGYMHSDPESKVYGRS